MQEEANVKRNFSDVTKTWTSENFDSVTNTDRWEISRRTCKQPVDPFASAWILHFCKLSEKGSLSTRKSSFFTFFKRLKILKPSRTDEIWWFVSGSKEMRRHVHFLILGQFSFQTVEIDAIKSHTTFLCAQNSMSGCYLIAKAQQWFTQNFFGS